MSYNTRNERNPCLKQNRPDRSYRDTLLSVVSDMKTAQMPCYDGEAAVIHLFYRAKSLSI